MESRLNKLEQFFAPVNSGIVWEGPFAPFRWNGEVREQVRTSELHELVRRGLSRLFQTASGRSPSPAEVEAMVALLKARYNEGMEPAQAEGIVTAAVVEVVTQSVTATRAGEGL